MRDVAALAGVSLKTVSRAINREPGVSPVLAAKVMDAVDALNFRPNLTASNLRRADQRTGTIGLVVQDVSNEFFGAIHRGAEDRARESGSAVVALSIDREDDFEADAVRALAVRRVDGLILSPTATHQSYLAVEQTGGWPIVCVDRSPVGVHVDTVVTNNAEGVAQGVSHLVRQGHQQIAFLGGQEQLTTSRERLVGYRQAMQDCALPRDASWEFLDLKGSDQAAAVVMSMFQDGLTKSTPTALFCGQNRVTVGAIRALRELGLHHRVALVGFDDFTLADMLDPAVAVVAQDPRAMGYLAAELVFRRMSDPHSEPREHIVPCSLIVRASGLLAPARGDAMVDSIP